MDIRKIALETPLKKVAYYVEAWKTWVNIQELSGQERAELLEKCSSIIKMGSKRESKINMKMLYPMLVVLSLRNPSPDCMPDSDDPHYDEYPGVGAVPLSPDAGELVFTLADLGPLNKASGAVLEVVAKPASIMSGLREEDIEEKKESSEPETIVQSDGYTIE